MNLPVIERGRYQNGVRLALQQFISGHVKTDAAALLAKWSARHGGLLVAFTFPELPPEAHLDCPRVVIEEPADEVDKTFASSGQALHYGEWHRMAVELRIETDDHTGGTLTGTDVAGAIQLAFADHQADLERIGIKLQRSTAEAGTRNPDTGLLEKTVRVELDLQVIGEALRTLELELARWTFSATGQGYFSAGLTLEVAQKLRLKLLTGTGTNASAVTVVALNSDGAERRLRATVPATRSAGTYLALLDEDPADSYDQVTGIVVTPGSGLPGEAFVVANIPEELGG